MPIYLGYPVKFGEALRVCGLPFTTTVSELEAHLRNHGLGLFSTTNAQYIIGLCIPSLYLSTEELVSIDSMILELTMSRAELKKKIQDAHIDIGTIDIYAIGSEPKMQKYPDPYLLWWEDESDIVEADMDRVILEEPENYYSPSNYRPTTDAFYGLTSTPNAFYGPTSTSTSYQPTSTD